MKVSSDAVLLLLLVLVHGLNDHWRQARSNQSHWPRIKQQSRAVISWRKSKTFY